MHINSDTGQILLAIARKSIDARLADRNPKLEETYDPILNQNFGCFVTIKIDNRLRGCIGNFVGTQPLHKEVAQMALAAATMDPRFQPMNAADSGRYTLDISVLSPRCLIESIDQIEVGTHGIYLENDGNRGVLLPQVAVENGWNRQIFLEQTCIKAGLVPDAWRSKQTSIYIFSAQIFTET